MQRVKDITRYLEKEDIVLPSGGRFSVLRFRQLGWLLGFHGMMLVLPGAKIIANQLVKGELIQFMVFNYLLLLPLKLIFL